MLWKLRQLRGDLNSGFAANQANRRGVLGAADNGIKVRHSHANYGNRISIGSRQVFLLFPIVAVMRLTGRPMLDWLRRMAATSRKLDSPKPSALLSEPPRTDRTAVATSQLSSVESIRSAEKAMQNGNRIAAIDFFNQAHSATPDDLYVLYWLATLYQEQGQLVNARRFAQMGLALDPAQIGLLLRFGNIAAAMEDFVVALQTYQHVATLDPEVPEIDALLADQYCHIGRIDDGIAAFDRAIVSDPGSIVLEQNRLFVLNYSDGISPAALLDEHRKWAARHEPPPRRNGQEYAGSRDPMRRLKVGLVSPDLRNHAVAHFAECLLRGYSRKDMELICFDTSTEAEDAIALRLKPMAAEWHRVGALDDDALASAIRDRQVDLLIDLSGHTKHNRLLVFARKPAPVQATWLGYLATTGMSSMDYRFTDSHMDPPGMTEELHTEKLVRMPVQACFKPWPDSPEVGELPAHASGHITYGMVNQWPKASRGALDLWAQILVANRKARIRIVAKGGNHEGLKELIVAEFTRRGALNEQVEVHGFLHTAGFLRLLNTIDIALDPFPYGGGTTTMHCLWMGVPVITLEGRTALSRNSIGPLIEVGLGELVAEDAAAYVRTALRLGADTSRLDAIRAALRPAMSTSRLTDELAFGAAFGTACREAWQAYCASPGV